MAFNNKKCGLYDSTIYCINIISGANRNVKENPRSLKLMIYGYND